jgi:2-polyprenyl-3-methyl-5-hydroxy-6-metoxy-1,4-benzoquinol methylase
MDPSEIREESAFKRPWYYRLELAPDLHTDGPPRWSVAQTRALLRRVDIESGGDDGSGARCLDVGIQEGLVTFLLERRGASEIVGYDRVLRTDRIDLAQRALGGSFDLVGGMKLQDLPRALAEQGRRPFDVVVFSGVLYHMFDPLGGLSAVRGLVRDGGICLVETAAAFSESDAMYFNSAGRFAPHALWLVTPPCLDYLLRFLRLEPLDVVYILGRGEGELASPAERRGIKRLLGRARRSGRVEARARHEREVLKPAQGRVAIACRAVSSPPAQPDDTWINAKHHDVDFAEFLDWNGVASDAPEVGYDGSRAGLIKGEDGSVAVQPSIVATQPLPLNPEQAQLALDARY